MQLQELTLARVVTRARSQFETAISVTPETCLSLGSRILAIGTGECRVRVMNTDTSKVVSSSRYTVVNGTSGTSRAYPLDPIQFGYLEVMPQSSLRGISSLIGPAKEVVVVGHTAILTGSNRWNDYLSQQRAENVKHLLRRFGVATRITTVALGGTAPISRVLTEAEQRQNRRVIIYVVPKGN